MHVMGHTVCPSVPTSSIAMRMAYARIAIRTVLLVLDALDHATVLARVLVDRALWWLSRMMIQKMLLTACQLMLCVIMAIINTITRTALCQFPMLWYADCCCMCMFISINASQTFAIVIQNFIWKSKPSITVISSYPVSTVALFLHHDNNSSSSFTDQSPESLCQRSSHFFLEWPSWHFCFQLLRSVRRKSEGLS